MTDEDVMPLVEPNMLRHMILNSIRAANRTFGQYYGRLVICTDNHNYWRKSFFKHYKANRKKERDLQHIDWPLVFKTLNELRAELKAYFPYKLMDVQMAEADDVIAILAKHFHAKEPILILSGDNDFKQLQVYNNVEQFNPVRDEYLKADDPKRILKEHIIRGDKGDGIPNFLSADEVFVTPGLRQEKIFETKVAVWVTQEPEEFCNEQTIKNYMRNKKLVDLVSEIPATVEWGILEEFKKPIQGHKNMILGYLVKNKMKNLVDFVRDF